MYKSKFLILRIKTFFVPFCICAFIILLLVFSKTNLSAVESGLILWVNFVVPSIFPFLIATETLCYTNIVPFLGKLLNKIMKPIFNLPGESAFPFIMGIICGYPIGAKIVSNLKLQQRLTTVEAERLIAFTNNSGPFFIIGTVGAGFFKSTTVGLLLLFTHILASLSVGFVFRWWKYNTKKDLIKTNNLISCKESISFSNLGEVLSNSIMKSVNTILLIGGFIVLFSIVISIFKNSGILYLLSKLSTPLLNILNIPSLFADGIITSLLEVTNGIYNVVSIPYKLISLNIVICAFLLGFGGLCIALQILSIISKAQISIKPYLIGKLLQGILAAVYTYFIIYFIPIFNLDLWIVYLFFATSINPLNNGPGLFGLDLNSGWNCEATKYGWSFSSTISTNLPSGDVPEHIKPASSIFSL